MKVAVTAASGQLGSEIAQQLVGELGLPALYLKQIISASLLCLGIITRNLTLMKP